MNIGGWSWLCLGMYYSAHLEIEWHCSCTCHSFILFHKKKGTRKKSKKTKQKGKYFQGKTMKKLKKKNLKHSKNKLQIGVFSTDVSLCILLSNGQLNWDIFILCFERVCTNCNWCKCWLLLSHLAFSSSPLKSFLSLSPLPLPPL